MDDMKVFSYVFPNLVYAEVCHLTSLVLSADLRSGALCYRHIHHCNTSCGCRHAYPCVRVNWGFGFCWHFLQCL